MTNESAAFNPAAKYVRVTTQREDGFVEFDFAIGEPELFVEMILPRAAFGEFCRANAVIVLDGPRVDSSPENDWAWRMNQASKQGFRK